jgi:Carboxypeptidase regulatory-like domain
MVRAKLFAALGALMLLLAFPVVARAQSGIVGVVKDATGGVLPGVTIEASSPVLIEKTRAAVTDAQGQYRLVDLRPGSYVVVFTLPGFSTVRREGIDLPADFTATLNVDLRVGSVEETITVSGQTPVVDVQTAARPQVINRTELDALPSGRTIQAVGALVVGVSLSVPDTGGTTALQQTYMSVHGATSGNVTVFVDGINITGMQGSVQAYWNEAMNQEVSYQTSGMSAEVPGGGVRVNMIPREGGNAFSGSYFGSFSNKGLEGSNLSDDLKAAGLKSVDKIDKVWDTNISQGGRLVRNKLWFFGSYRYFGIDAPVAETFYKDGRQGISDEHQQNYLARLTYQVSPKAKLSAYYDRVYRFRGHSMGAGDDPATAAIRWTTPTTYDGEAKLTMTATPKLLYELGFAAISTLFDTGHVDPSLKKLRGTPEWYATTRKTDIDLGTTWGAGTEGRIGPFRDHINSALSYVSGNHNLKGGVQYSWGVFHRQGDENADLIQRYRSGVPTDVVVANTPRAPRDKMDADVGVYVQDQWRMNRLTVSPGLRYELLKNSMPLQYSPAGRFKPAAILDPKDGADWKNWSPRLGVAYDVFGTSKTAVKGSIAKYNTSERTDFIDAYNPVIAASTAALTWTDLNGDDIAQGELGCTYPTAGCEINMAQLPRGFGTPSLSISPTEDLRTNGRGYNYEYSVGAEQQIWTNLSIAGTFFARNFYHYVTTDYTDRSAADYTPVTVFSPLDGSVFQVYNLDPTKVALTNRVDRIADDSTRYNYYRGFEFSFRSRLPGRGSFFGGTSTGRTISVTCDQPDNPNLLRFCDQTQSGVTPPNVTSLKLSGSYPLPQHVQFGISYVHQPGAALNTTWLITRTTRYAANCKGPCTPNGLVMPTLSEASLTVPLIPNGTETLPALNNLDMRFGRTFKVGRYSLEGMFEVFNLLNTSTTLAVRSTNFGTATFHVPGGSGDVGTRGAIPYARFVKFGFQANW